MAKITCATIKREVLKRDPGLKPDHPEFRHVRLLLADALAPPPRRSGADVRGPVERHGTSTDGGLIVHDDRPISWEAADAAAGRRLDRRKNYAVINGQVCSAINWTQRCSGCSIGHEDRGGGCEECGYHGVVRDSMWFPHDGSEPRSMPLPRSSSPSRGQA